MQATLQETKAYLQFSKEVQDKHDIENMEPRSINKLISGISNMWKTMVITEKERYYSMVESSKKIASRSNIRPKRMDIKHYTV